MPDPQGHRSLHLGVIHGGRIIHEHVVPPGTPVTVGESSAATLIVPKTARTGPKRTLFATVGTKIALTFSADMVGSVTVGDTEVDLATLRDKGVAKKQGDVFILPLVSDARGSVELGDVVIAFDFIVPVQAPVRLHLPVEVRSSLVGRFDSIFAVALTASSVAFGILLLYLSTIVVPEEVPFDQIDDRFVRMIMPQKLEPLKKEEAPKAAVKEEKKTEEKKEEKKVDPDDKDAVAARKKDIQQKVAGKGVLAILGTKGLGKGAVADVFSEGRTLTNDIDAAFTGIGGVEVANGGNTTSRGGGTASGTSSSIGALATSGTGKVGLVEKVEARVGNVKLSETPEVDGSLNQADIARVVRGRLTAIKECYERELKRNPQLAGKVVVRFTIDEEGRVTQATIEENTLSDKNVAICVTQRVERFRFPKPDGGSVTVAYPFIFAPST